MDALNFTLTLDQVLERRMQFLAPKFNAFTLDKPGELSDAVSISKPVLENIASWYEDQDEPPDPEKRIRMMDIAMA